MGQIRLSGIGAISLFAWAGLFAMGHSTLGDQSLRTQDLVTFNMWVNQDQSVSAPWVASELLQSKSYIVPDLMFLQEVEGTLDSNSPERLIGRMLGYSSFFFKSKSGMDQGEGLAIIARDEFEYVDHKVLSTRDYPSGPPRVALMVEVMSAERVRYINIHLSYTSIQIRLDQLEEVLEWIAARDRLAPAEMMFLGGDFNFEPNSVEIRYLLNNNLIPFQNHNRFDRVTFPSKSKRLDYIFSFCRDPSAIEILHESLLFKSREKPLSDHYGLRHFYRADFEAESVHHPTRSNRNTL